MNTMDTLRDDQCECEASDGYWTSGIRGILAHVDEKGYCDSFIQAHGECDVFKNDLIAARSLRRSWVKAKRIPPSTKVRQRTVDGIAFYFLEVLNDAHSAVIIAKLRTCNPI